MSKTLMVGSLDELYDALAAAEGGETILLEGGNYGHLYIGNKSGYDVDFPDTVTIASADADNPAVFAEARIMFVSNLTFDGVVFDYTYAPGDLRSDNPFEVWGSQDITIRNSTFDGDVASGLSAEEDGYGFGKGFYVRETVGMTLEDSEILGFEVGLVFYDSQEITVTGNDIHSMRKDGMNLAAVQDVLIEDNHIHDFKGRPGSEDHRDMIQFFTNGTTSPNTDIVIRGNHLDIGEGSYTQSIFMRNEEVDLGRAGEEMFYQNVLIEENVIVNAQLHGITVGETDGLTIRNNTIIQAGEGVKGADVPRINLNTDSKNVTVLDNAVSEITGYEVQPDWTIDGNVFVQMDDPNKDGYYGDLFITSTIKGADGSHMPLARSDSILIESGAGATVTRAGPPQDTAAFHVEPYPDNSFILVFDASISNVPEGSRYLWNFSDGSTGEGISFTRPFPEGGQYEATLTIETPEDDAITASVDVMIRGNQILSMSDGGFIIHGYGENTVTQADAIDDTGALHLVSNGLSARVAVNDVRPLANADEFSVTMTLEADGTGQNGQVFWLHQCLVVSVNSGKLQVIAYTEDGRKLVMHSADTLSEDSAQDIAINLDDGMLSLVIDGELSSEMEIGSGLNPNLTQDLYFGTPWGEPNFGGSVSNFAITVNQSDYEEARILFETPVQDVPDVPDVVPAPDLPDWVDSIDLIDLHFGQDSVDVIAGPKLEKLPQSYLDPILGEDAFRFSFDLTGDDVGSKGDVMRLKGAFWVKVQSEGELAMWVREDDGDITFLRTSGAELNDLNTSRIEILLEDDILAIYVDDVVRAATVMDSAMTDGVTSELEFGSSNGRETFDGRISNLTIGLDIADEVQMMELMALPQFDFDVNVF